MGYTASEPGFRAAIWAGGTTTLLGGPFSLAYAINNLGQTVGTLGSDGGNTQATIWNGTTPSVLGTLENLRNIGLSP